MNSEDLYGDREDLMTPEELEEYHHEPSSETIPTYSPQMRTWIFDRMLGNTPELEYKAEFLRRKPALGLTKDQIQHIRQHNAKLLPVGGVQQRTLFKSIRSHMLRYLIPCPGATTLEDLLQILEQELASGIPAAVPEWYEFSNVRFGPRRIGYYACDHRGCFQTETVDQQFARCAKCKLARYCSKECQTADWKGRHKQVCAKGQEQREKVLRASQALSMFAMKHEGR